MTHNEKGYTGIDIAISVVILAIFVSLIAVIIFRFNSSGKEVEYKSEATYIAIDEIEKVKKEGITPYLGKSIKNENNEIIKDQSVAGKEGYYKTVTVEDYTDIEGNENKIQDLVKRVTVKISYIFQGKEQNVELSTIVSKES